MLKFPEHSNLGADSLDFSKKNELSAVDVLKGDDTFLHHLVNYLVKNTQSFWISVHWK